MRRYATGLLCLGLACCGGGGGTSSNGSGIDTLAPSPRSLDYLRSDTFSRLVLEVDSVPGFAPRASSQSGVEDRLLGLLSKPGGIVVTLDGSIPSRGSDHRWTFGELIQLAAQTADLAVPAGTTKMHVLFVDGAYDSGPGGGTVLGIAWDQQNIVIFKQTLESLCAGAGLPGLGDQLCSDAELAIWLHEIGHVLGLVDNGVPMVTPHEDPAHPGHDIDNDCLMYWAYEGDALFSRISGDLLGGGSSSLDFDAACREDLAAARGSP